jgi:hypothetical protein
MRPVDLSASLAIEPVTMGPLTLLGFWIPSSCLHMRARRMIWVESYWSIQEKTNQDLLLDITAGLAKPRTGPRFGGGMRHEPCDWMWPTSRWEPGVVYRDIAGLPPPAALCSGELDIEFRVFKDSVLLGAWAAPKRLLLELDKK